MTGRFLSALFKGSGRDRDCVAKAINSSLYDALIFDMDGTIIDNMQVHHRAWQHLLLDLGHNWSLAEVKERVWGKNEEIFERIFPGRFTPEQVKEFADGKERHYVELYRDEIEMLAGLEQLLIDARSRGMKLGIATAAPPICVDFVREALQLEKFFDIIVDASQVLFGKPHPEVYLSTAEKLGVASDRCLVFEDAPVGVEAAKRAEMPTYVLLTTHSKEEFARYPNVAGYALDFREFTVV